MTIAGKIESTIAIPGGVTVNMDGNVLTVKGPKGELSRNFAHPGIDMAVTAEGVSVSCEYPRIKDKAMVGTYVAHVRNMIHGVTGPNEYENNVNNNWYTNYSCVQCLQSTIKGCTVKISGQDVTVEGIDIEACGQTAANLEKATSRLGFDKRTFQDGIYIVQKSHKVKE